MSLIGLVIGHSPEYKRKQLHVVKHAPVVVRESWILGHVLGKNVLELGASGPMHDAIVEAARLCCGIDRYDGNGVIGFNLDDVSQSHIPCTLEPDVIVLGEVLEHLSNPGWTLTRLRRKFRGIPLVITVPNAFSDIARRKMENGVENVNIDHVAWYSPRTIQTLLEREGYTIEELAWYNGRERFSEGICILAR